LRFGIDIERDRSDDVLDTLLESLSVVQDNESIDDIYQGEGKVASDIVRGDVGTVGDGRLVNKMRPEREHARIIPVRAFAGAGKWSKLKED
jgi:hypothetical protein